MYFIGLMSGTSMDAIDTALVKFDNKASLELYREYPIDNSIRYQIRNIDEKSELNHVSELDNKLGYLFAGAVNNLLDEANLSPQNIIAIGSHGQTILHRPDAAHPTSIQIGNPNIISNVTGITTVADFRRMDIANGGQGAPLASAFHEYQFQHENKSVVILNIGGMANVTLLSNNDAIGFDTGPGNVLLDDWTQHNLSKEYDQDGKWAKQGNPNQDLLALMLGDNYFNLAPPKSTGREYFNMAWLKTYTNQLNADITPEDVQATLLQLSAQTIVDAIKDCSENIDEVLVCGGGAYNLLLMETLLSLLGSDISLATTGKYGLTPACIEAITFAWLAKQRIENKPANLPGVTGANRKVLLGGIYASG